MIIKRYLFVLTLMLCMGVFLLQTFASTGGGEALTVSAAFIKGETLHIEIMNTQTGENEAIELDIKDLAKDKEIISIQAMDFEGKQSNVIQIKNPFYQSKAVAENPKETETPEDKKTESTKNTEKNPFTPDGTGSVVDNATVNDEKEFFTIKTDDDNIFYLVVDRQKNADNVYLLNAVNEGDLMALAEKGSAGGIPAPPTPTPESPPSETKPPEPEPPEKENGSSNIFIIIIILIVVGGVGYYLKIYKPKQDKSLADDNFENEDDNDVEDEDFLFGGEELEDYEDTDAFDDEAKDEKGSGEE